MRTKSINLYKVHELSEVAQQAAHSNYLNEGFEYAWLDESIESVKAYVSHFGGEVRGYELSTYRHSFITVDIDNPRGFKASECPEFLTGYCIDETFRLSFLAYASKNGDIRGAILHAVDQCVTDIISDMEYQETMEYFLEMAESNEWEYDENGNFC